jgi:hypothetical protein
MHCYTQGEAIVKFTPKSDEQIANESEFTPWREGIYDFEVTAGEDQVSKAGNEMIKLTLKVYDEEGRSRTVFDYLLESVAYKLKNAASACGVDHLYNGGTLEGSDFEGRTGKLKLGIRPARDGYQASNTVKDYVVDKPTNRAPPKMATKADLDDEIPF